MPNRDETWKNIFGVADFCLTLPEMKTLKITTFITIILAVLTLTSCGKKKHFVIQGQLEGLGAQMVTLTYFADEGLKRETVSAEAGKFVFRGESNEPTLCLIEANGRELISIVAQNGDKIQLSGDFVTPYSIKAKGNGTSRQISDFLAANSELFLSGNAEAINRKIGEFVTKNRNSIASVALMTSYFRTPGFEVLADSLLRVISPDVRTAPIMQNFGPVLATQLTKHTAREVLPMSIYLRTDTVISFSPSGSSYTLLAFVGDNKTMRDSVIPHLRKLNEMPKRRMQVLEISTAKDSALWKRSTAADSAGWHQMWSPGTIAGVELHNLAVPRIPFFIISDSVGAQVLRTSSVKAAVAELNKRLPNK